MPLVPHPDVPWVYVEQVEIDPPEYTIFCQVCGRGGLASAPAADAFLAAHAAHQSASPTHQGMGDVIARAAKAIGFDTPCTPCEQRRRALNNAVPRMPFFRR